MDADRFHDVFKLGSTRADGDPRHWRVEALRFRAVQGDTRSDGEELAEDEIAGADWTSKRIRDAWNVC
jgi:hypothetical protein